MKKITLIVIAIIAATILCGKNLQFINEANATRAIKLMGGSTEQITIPGFGRKAPAAISGDNIYVAWWTNETGNDEVMFRMSIDNAATFSDKINLSNSTNAESQDVEIASEGDNVVISWWERNQTAEEPVARISTDNGATFGPILRLANNGTIGKTEAAE